MALTGLNVLQGTSTHYYSFQNQDYSVAVGGVATNFEGSQGYYASTVNVRTGLFVAEDNFSPSEMIKQNPSWYTPNQPPPALNNWADVTFLQWYTAAKVSGGSNNAILKRARSLKYFVRYHIINAESQGIIDHALQNVGATLQPWPNGHTFPMTTDEGKAILGSPNGRGVAFFLYQHKTVLGIKTVDSVTIFSTTGKDSDSHDETWYQAIFTLRDA
ncbi:hypothetical protein BP5796_12170 [Coleophoma crateriformis]|uniref:Uncharacterized protein n=1 Tax=Coleophoma crateriformis TaxID=565419 RepID=A0A3D8QBM5_9HELO|nr:hypothetical protein BP5796_12170 [Coleophoma crateriformis]